LPIATASFGSSPTCRQGDNAIIIRLSVFLLLYFLAKFRVPLDDCGYIIGLFLTHKENKSFYNRDKPIGPLLVDVRAACGVAPENLLAGIAVAFITVTDI